MENKLPESFKSKGFQFTQVDRTNDFAIFLKENGPIESENYYFCYEVIKVQRQKANTISIGGNKIFYPQREVYPGDKSWGVLGWSFRTLPEAKVYFAKLTEKVSPSAYSEVKTEDLGQYSIFESRV